MRRSGLARQGSSNKGPAERAYARALPTPDGISPANEDWHRQYSPWFATASGSVNAKSPLRSPSAIRFGSEQQLHKYRAFKRAWGYQPGLVKSRIQGSPTGPCGHAGFHPRILSVTESIQVEAEALSFKRVEHSESRRRFMAKHEATNGRT